jgi:arabinogalactan oligomer / maltooligosaccharide transport system substrate-binding protein
LTRVTTSALGVVAASAALLLAACGSDAKTATSEAASVTTAAVTTVAATAAPATEAATTTAAAAPASEAPTTTVYAPPVRGDADLVIWADDTRAPVLKPIADKFAAEEGITVSVLEVPFDKIKDSLARSAPAGEGPDIVIGAHDWLGGLVKDGVVAPVDLGASASGYSDVSIKAFTYEGKVYGLPYAVENIALIRNADLVPEAPKTFAELEKIALDLKAAGTVDVPLAVQQGPADPYHNFPLFSGFGANVFAQNADGTYDPTKLGLDTPEGLEAAAGFAAWSKSGLISKDVTYDIMIDSFGSGKAPFAITGPWAVSDAERGFKAKGVNYVVEPIPAIKDGVTPKVFVGVQGFMISQFSENQDLAKTFLLDYINAEDVQLQLFEAGGRPPAMTSAFDKVSSDPDIKGFGLAGQNGQPQPAIPAMGSVWDTWKDAYNLVFTGTDPTKAFSDAAVTIRAKIAG